MALTDADVARIVRGMLDAAVDNLDPATGQPAGSIRVRTVLSQLERWEDQERGVVAGLAAAMQALTAAVSEVQGQVTSIANILDAIVSDPGGLDGEQLTAVAEDVVARVVARLAGALTPQG